MTPKPTPQPERRKALSRIICVIFGHKYGKGEMYHPDSIYWQRFVCIRCGNKIERFV